MEYHVMCVRVCLCVCVCRGVSTRAIWWLPSRRMPLHFMLCEYAEAYLRVQFGGCHHGECLCILICVAPDNKGWERIQHNTFKVLQVSDNFRDV